MSAGKELASQGLSQLNDPKNMMKAVNLASEAQSYAKNVTSEDKGG